MTQNTGNDSKALQQVFDYHQASKHQLQHYARGPGYLDWASQPDPFRRYQGAPLIALQKAPSSDQPRYDHAFVQGRIPPAALNLRSISQLFYHSLAISAWKSSGDSRWSLRVNPSSGNLHPTEGYLLCGAIEGLCDTPMVGHYAPQEHGLEVLTEFDPRLWGQLCGGFADRRLLLILTSIHWREAWKYGYRAYRYCQHDAGHAIGAISLAAAGLGWEANVVDDLSSDELALLSGTFRTHDAEREEPDVLLALGPPDAPAHEAGIARAPVATFASLDWQGCANQLSPSHVDWGIEEVAAAVRQSAGSERYPQPRSQPTSPSPDIRPLARGRMIRQRRSAVAMDAKTYISRDRFFAILQRTLATAGHPLFSALPWRPHIHLAIFVHRVDDLPSGLYLLVRDGSQTAALQAALTSTNSWQRPRGCPPSLELYCLVKADAREVARQISCGQDIASDGCFSLAMIAEFQSPLARVGPAFYSRLFWEAGVIGQLLYLEAEAAGIRSTGIGCYFDDAMHQVLGINDSQYQDLYHFTVGGPVEDSRLVTLSEPSQ